MCLHNKIQQKSWISFHYIHEPILLGFFFFHWLVKWMHCFCYSRIYKAMFHPHFYLAPVKCLVKRTLRKRNSWTLEKTSESRPRKGTVAGNCHDCTMKMYTIMEISSPWKCQGYPIESKSVTNFWNLCLEINSELSFQ